MEVKAVAAMVDQKLTDTLYEDPIANNKVMIHQLKQLQKSLKKLQSFSEEKEVSDTSQKSRDYLCVLYEAEDEIEKLSFRVAQRRKRFWFLMNQTFFLNNLNSCRMLIRKINKILTTISSFPEDLAANPRGTITSSSTVWPIPQISSSSPSPKQASLSRSLSMIPHFQKHSPQKKKLRLSNSYKNDDVLTNAHDQCSNEVVLRGYNNMTFDLRLCLLYLASFPNDFDIPVRRLLRRWVAEGFVTRRSRQPPFPEDLVQKHFEDLVDRGMIQITKLRSDNSPKKCRLFPVLHNSLSPKAQDIGLFYIHHNLEHFEDAAGPFGVRRMVQQMGPTGSFATSAWARKLDTSLLRSYVSFNCPRKDTSAKEVGILLNRIIKSDVCLLTVLDLEGVNQPILPDKLGHLSLLKYLGLRRTYLDILPESVGDLSYLETLDVKHTNVNSLPDSVCKLKKLRHLNLNNIRLAMPPCSSLTLVTLWGLVLDEKISINEGLGMLLNLRELGIKFQLSTRSQGVLLDWITKLVNLQSLRLTSVNDMGRASKLILKPLVNLNKLSHLNLYGNLERLPTADEFPPTVKVLTLSISLLNNDPMETLERLPFLMVLRLLGDSFTGKRMVCHRGGFKKLEVLKLWKLAGLEDWDVEEEAMESLKQIDIRCCHKLKTISSRLLLKPRLLEELILTDMPDDFVARITNRKSTDTSLKSQPIE